MLRVEELGQNDAKNREEKKEGHRSQMRESIKICFFICSVSAGGKKSRNKFATKDSIIPR